MARRTLSDIERIGRKWQKRLELHGWNIEFVRVHPSQLSDKLDYANINWDIPSNNAQVRVSEETENCDLESSILHELVHLRTEGHEDCDGEYDPHMERNIEALTNCLLKRKR